jgi:hypothetical protein
MPALKALVGAPRQAGLIPKASKQRLDSTLILGDVAVLSALENVRESLRWALEELDKSLESKPEFWQEYWERYVESKVDRGL